MNAIYLSHITQVAEGIVIRKHTVGTPTQNQPDRDVHTKYTYKKTDTLTFSFPQTL